MLFIKILVIAAITITLFMLWSLMAIIGNYFSAKRNQIINDPNVYGDKLDITGFALQAIDVIIKREVDGKVMFLQLSKTSYNMLNLDEDVEKLGTYIFQCFKREFYTSDALMLTSDYIMKYITTETSLYMVLAMREANIEIYREKK